MTIAKGTFDVELTPVTDEHATTMSGIGRLLIRKRLEGDLAGDSVGEMLAVNTGTEGSAGYVAMERFTGELHGRRGTFVLQHDGAMAAGTSRLSIQVVPDSGTDALTGITGTMTIEVVDGRHHYAFDYTLRE